MAQMGQGGFFPTNPDLANILGDMDFGFENFFFLDFLGPKFLAWAQLGPGLGPAWAQLGPSLGPAWAHPLGPGLAWLGPTHLGPAGAARVGRGALGRAGWAPIGPKRVNRAQKNTLTSIFRFFRPTQKMGPDGPK